MERLTLACLSHLPSAVLFVLDLTAQCGTSVQDQLLIRSACPFKLLVPTHALASMHACTRAFIYAFSNSCIHPSLAHSFTHALTHYSPVHCSHRQAFSHSIHTFIYSFVIPSFNLHVAIFIHPCIDYGIFTMTHHVGSYTEQQELFKTNRLDTVGTIVACVRMSYRIACCSASTAFDCTAQLHHETGLYLSTNYTVAMIKVSMQHFRRSSLFAGLLPHCKLLD